jgi:hypothetical protein
MPDSDQADADLDAGTKTFPRVEEAALAVRMNGTRHRRPKRVPLDPSTLPPDDPYFDISVPLPNGRRCVRCGRELLALNRKYCNDQCASRYRYEQNQLQAGKAISEPRQLQRAPDGRCVRCGAELVGRQSRFCGTRCSSAFYDKRRMDRAINQAEPTSTGGNAPEPVTTAGITTPPTSRLEAAAGQLAQVMASGVIDHVELVTQGWTLRASRLDTPVGAYAVPPSS